MLAALVEGRVAQQAGLGVVGVRPALGEPCELLDERVVADDVRDLRGAPVGERDVERVADRVRLPAQQEVLAVGAPQVVVHVDERPLPVDPGDAALAEVGEEGVRQRAALAREAVAADRHPVADREVPLLLGDREQRIRELDGALGIQRSEQR